MTFGKKAKFEELREIGFADITSEYTQLGPSITENVRILTLKNLTDQQIYVSLDGVKPHIKMPAKFFQILDIAANQVRGDVFFLEVGEAIFIKWANGAGTEGDFLVETTFGSVRTVDG